MSLRIVKQGQFDTIQDLGRYGYQNAGVNPGGAMDKVAVQIANILVGNEVSEAVIELHFPSSSVLFEESAMIAICGGDFSPSINDEPVCLNCPIIVSKYQVLQFDKLVSGRTCYLAVRELIDVPKWLGSYSTNTKAQVGGYHGSKLQKDDLLQFRNIYNYNSILEGKNYCMLHWKADLSDFYLSKKTLRICVGPEFNCLTTASKQAFTESSFTISNQSDKMGYRMNGHRLELENDFELVSSGVVNGTIQLLPDGQLIILMADHQTTGGYPRIGFIIGADQHLLAQKNPGEQIQFELISQEDSEEYLLEQQHHLNVLKNSCLLTLQNYLLHHELHRY